MGEDKRIVVLIAGASEATRLAAEAMRKFGDSIKTIQAEEYIEELDALVEHEGKLAVLEHKTASQYASANINPRRNKSDRKRNKRQRWK